MRMRSPAPNTVTVKTTIVKQLQQRKTSKLANKNLEVRVQIYKAIHMAISSQTALMASLVVQDTSR